MPSINGIVDTSTVAPVTMGGVAALIVLSLFLLFIGSVILCLLFVAACGVYEYYKSSRKGPITLTPVIPFPQDNLYLFKGTDSFKNVVPDAKIQYGNGTTKKPGIRSKFMSSEYGIYAPMNEFMASTFKLDSRLPHDYEEVYTKTSEKHYRIKTKISVPNRARTISIKMNGFEHGEKCHDFVPIGGAAPESHFTYQMYGDNRIQVTRYVVDEKSEIAGFCIYIENGWLSHGEYRWPLLKSMAQSAKTSTLPEAARTVEITANPQVTERRRENQPKIEVVPEENTNLISDESDDREWTVKYCSKLQRKAMTSIDSDEVAVHQEWVHGIKYMRIVKCKECTKEGLGKEEQPPTYSSIFIA
ncbi:unnamed protein product [Caenorhabditis brenneri]